MTKKKPLDRYPYMENNLKNNNGGGDFVTHREFNAFLDTYSENLSNLQDNILNINTDIAIEKTTYENVSDIFETFNSEYFDFVSSYLIKNKGIFELYIYVKVKDVADIVEEIVTVPGLYSTYNIGTLKNTIINELKIETAITNMIFKNASLVQLDHNGNVDFKCLFYDLLGELNLSTGSYPNIDCEMKFKGIIYEE